MYAERTKRFHRLLRFLAARFLRAERCGDGRLRKLCPSRFTRAIQKFSMCASQSASPLNPIGFRL